ncbi:hypothetical protein Syun_025049 [Stephania yunnanensis]|uniref:Uncharacterized protein n=1 Tax=Stephania yunnanensis TaxID=152371 RepID=A0AAP0EZR1_9MAGN
MFNEMLHLDIRNWTSMTLAYVWVGEAKQLAALSALIISCFALGTAESRSIESICVALANLLCSNKVPNGVIVAVISDLFFKLDKIFANLLREDSSMHETIALALLGLVNQNMIIVQPSCNGSETHLVTCNVAQLTTAARSALHHYSTKVATKNVMAFTPPDVSSFLLIHFQRRA